MKKSNKHIIGTILMIVGVIFLILSGTDTMRYQFDTTILVDGMLITYHKVLNVVISLVALLMIVVGGFLRDH